MSDLAQRMNQNMAGFACRRAGDALDGLGYSSFVVVVVAKADEHVTCAVVQRGELEGAGDAVSGSLIDWATRHIGLNLPESTVSIAEA